MRSKGNNELLVIGIVIYMILLIVLCKTVNAETKTYVQYINGSDEYVISDIVKIDIKPDQSLLGYTSEEDTDCTVTDSQQDLGQIIVYETRDYEHLKDEEVYLLAKLVQCEAGDQDILTKQLVVLSVLNRVNDDKFPDSIEKVIKENNHGVYQFSPLMDGGSWYNTEPSEEAYLAVESVSNFGYDFSGGVLYFENCQNENNWHKRNLEFLYKSGDLRFYK